MRRDGKTARRPDGKTASSGDAGVARHLEPDQEQARQHILDPAMVEIRPEPSPSERAAILIALERILGATRRDEAPRPHVWALAGRRESLLGRDGGSGIGWERGGDRLTGR